MANEPGEGGKSLELMQQRLMSGGATQPGDAPDASQQPMNQQQQQQQQQQEPQEMNPSPRPGKTSAALMATQAREQAAAEQTTATAAAASPQQATQAVAPSRPKGKNFAAMAMSAGATSNPMGSASSPPAATPAPAVRTSPSMAVPSRPKGKDFSAMANRMGAPQPQSQQQRPSPQGSPSMSQSTEAQRLRAQQMQAAARAAAGLPPLDTPTATSVTTVPPPITPSKRQNSGTFHQANAQDVRQQQQQQQQQAYRQHIQQQQRAPSRQEGSGTGSRQQFPNNAVLQQPSSLSHQQQLGGSMNQLPINVMNRQQQPSSSMNRQQQPVPTMTRQQPTSTMNRQQQISNMNRQQQLTSPSNRLQQGSIASRQQKSASSGRSRYQSTNPSSSRTQATSRAQTKGTEKSLPQARAAARNTPQPVAQEGRLSLTAANANSPAAAHMAPLVGQRIQDLVKSIDQNYDIDTEAEEQVLQLADDFLDKVIRQSLRLAQHRGSKTMDVQDVQIVLAKHWGISVPGLGLPVIRPLKPGKQSASKSSTSGSNTGVKRKNLEGSTSTGGSARKKSSPANQSIPQSSMQVTT